MTTDPSMQLLGERTHDGEPEQDLSTFLRDTSPEVTPATLDSSAFLAGVRPTRRSVEIVERADLVGDMERLAQLYAEADEADDDEACERLATEFETVSAAFHSSKRWYTVEKRSSEWIEGFREKVITEYDLDPGAWEKRAEGATQKRARMTVLLHQLAAQIVSPSGTSADDLRALYEANEGELNKLLVAMEYANNRIAESAKVATPGFSLRRSERKAAPGSPRR